MASTEYARKRRLGDITFQGGGSPLTRLTGRDVKERTSPYLTLLGQIDQKPQPGKLGAPGWSAPSGPSGTAAGQAAPGQAAPGATPTAAPPTALETMNTKLRAAYKDPSKIPDAITWLMSQGGAYAQKNVMPILETLTRGSARQAEIEALTKGGLAKIGATGEEARKTAVVGKEPERAFKREQAKAKRAAGIETREDEQAHALEELRVTNAHALRLKAMGQLAPADDVRVKAATKRLAQLNEQQYGKTGISQRRDTLERKLISLNESLDTELAMEDPKEGRVTQLGRQIRSAEYQVGQLDTHEARMNIEREGAQAELDAVLQRLEAPETPGAAATATQEAPAMEELTPEQPAAQPAEAETQLKSLTPNIIAEAKRLHGDDEEAAAMWLASQGYKLE